MPNSHVYDSILRVSDSILRVYDSILRVYDSILRVYDSILRVYDFILRVSDSILRVYDFILRVSYAKFPCFSFFSTTIWLERMFIYPIALIMLLIARLFSFSEKKSLRSDKIVVPLPMASKFELCF